MSDILDRLRDTNIDDQLLQDVIDEVTRLRTMLVTIHDCLDNDIRDVINIIVDDIDNIAKET